MNAETFTERKTKLEEFYKQRIKFNIRSIDINQANPNINIYDFTTNIFFKTHITFTGDKFLMSEFYKHLKPIIFYAYSYTIQKKHIEDDFILKEDNTIINYNYETDNNELYIKNLEIVLTTYYDFYHEDYDFYFWALAELEQNNELILSHEFTKEETKIINPSKIFKSEECIICLENQPIILFCICGHICICEECIKKYESAACPICKTYNEYIRKIDLKKKKIHVIKKMERETFKMRKQFLGDFFNNDRVEFFNTIKKDILIRKNFIRDHQYNKYILKTSLLFLDRHIFKLLRKFIKPFTYFLYSFTYQTNFLENKFLHFAHIDIKYVKQISNMEELLNKDVFFSINFYVPQPFLEEEETENNYLKSIKINDCLNENVGDLAHLKFKITTVYLNVEEEDYLILGGENIDMRRDSISQEDDTPLINQDRTKVINSSKSFKSNECVICLTNSPNVLFCNCGHLCLCLECERKKTSNNCPICKIENTIIRTLE